MTAPKDSPPFRPSPVFAHRSRRVGADPVERPVIDLTATRTGIGGREEGGRGGKSRAREEREEREAREDMRRHPRQPTRLRMGKIADLDDRFVSECVIRDVSPGGARLVLSARVSLPAIIILFDELEETIVPATVRWRRGNETGISFDVPPARLKQFRSRRLRVLAQRYYALDD